MKTAKFESKKRAILLSLLMVGLLVSLLNSPSATAADYLYKGTNCPKNNVTLLPPGSKLEITDIIISTDQDQRVTIKFQPGATIMSSFVAAFDTVVVNFSDPVDSSEEQALQMDCSGTAGTKVAITIVGHSTF